MAVQPEDLRLLANSRFRRLMEARAVAQTGQNAMLYTLLILVVNETASSIHSTLLITAWMLPAILIGVPAGGLADVLPKRALLVAGYAGRAAPVAAMILCVDGVWTLCLLVLAFSSVGQVSGPAEAAALPILVRRDQLTGANSWMVLSLMVGQAAGAVALAPFILKFIGAEASLAIAALLLAAARRRRPGRAAAGRADRVAGGGVVRPVDEPAGLPGAGLPDGRGDAGEGAGGPRSPLHPRRAEDRYGEYGVRGGPGGDRGAAGAGGDAAAGALGGGGEDGGGRG